MDRKKKGVKLKLCAHGIYTIVVSFYEDKWTSFMCLPRQG